MSTTRNLAEIPRLNAMIGCLLLRHSVDKPSAEPRKVISTINIRGIARRLMVGAALCVVPFTAMAQQSISVSPQVLLSRGTLARLSVTTTLPFAYGRESVTMVNNKLTVTMRSFNTFPVAGPGPPSNDVPATSMDVILGKLPQGNYSVEALFLDRLTGVLSSIGITQFAVSEDVVSRQAGYPAHDFTDLWWNPAESGWGISIHVKRAAFFAAWFAYDSVGNPTWYSLSNGGWASPKKYTGEIYATHASPNSGLGPISDFGVVLVGNGTLEFADFDRATFSFSVNGLANVKSIIREVF